MSKRWLLVVSAVVPMAFAQGCASSNSPVDDLATQDVVAGIGIGAVVGAVAGAIISGGEPEGMAIGAGAGAAVGGVVGAIAADRRKKHVSESDYLDTEIASAEKAVESKQSELEQLKKKLADLQGQADGLEARRQAGEDVSREQSTLINELDVQIKRNTEQIARYENAIAYIEHVLATSQGESEDLAKRRAELTDRKTKLLAQHDELSGMNKSFQQTRDTVAGRIMP